MIGWIYSHILLEGGLVNHDLLRIVYEDIVHEHSFNCCGEKLKVKDPNSSG